MRITVEVSSLEELQSLALRLSMPPVKKADASIEFLPLRPRVKSMLMEMGLNTIGKLRASEDRDLLRIQSFGRKAVAEIREAVSRFESSVEVTS